MQNFIGCAKSKSWQTQLSWVKLRLCRGWVGVVTTWRPRIFSFWVRQNLGISLCAWLYPRAQPVRLAIATRTTHSFWFIFLCAWLSHAHVYSIQRHLLELSLATNLHLHWNILEPTFQIFLKFPLMLTNWRRAQIFRCKAILSFQYLTYRLTD